MEDITKLAIKHKSDKYGSHFYTKIYEKYLKNKKNKKVHLLEIGIGGFSNGNYKSTNIGGESLKIWRDYFKNGTIIGLDIVKKNLKLGKRVKIFTGSQSSYFDLKKIVKKFKKFDFIIDDGSHKYNDVIFSFEFLFKFLKEGGYYFIEDVQSSYLREFGGDGMFLNNKKNITFYFKQIVDKINYREIENPFYKSDFFCENITEIHFYHNLIVVKKERNMEKSTVLVKNRKLVSGKNFLKTRLIIKKIKYYLLFLKGRINYFISLITI